jgi:hypothetical protein
MNATIRGHDRRAPIRENRNSRRSFDGKNADTHTASVDGPRDLERRDGMNHDALTNLRRLDTAERDRALAHAYDLRKRDGFAATERSKAVRMRSLIARAIRSHTHMMERIARALEQANQARSGEHTLPAPERTIL